VADRATLATKFDGVYALGDAVSLPLAVGKPLPKAGGRRRLRGRSGRRTRRLPPARGRQAASESRSLRAPPGGGRRGERRGEAPRPHAHGGVRRLRRVLRRGRRRPRRLRRRKFLRRAGSGGGAPRAGDPLAPREGPLREEL